MKKIFKREDKLVLFFVITLIWTWSFGFIPVIIGIEGTPLGTFLFYFGGGAPSVTALFLVFFTYTKEQKKDYFKRCFSFRHMGIKWLLLTILFFSVITIAALIIGVYLLGYEMPGMNYIHAIIQNPFYICVVLFLSVISGPLNEEFGWRGYALDRLFTRYGFVGATLILGFIWGIWHMAWYFTPGQAQYDMFQFSPFHAIMWIPSVTIFNFSVSYVYIKTKKSILAGALVHMFSNLLGSQLLSPYSAEMSMVLRYTTMFFCGCLALYCIFSPKFREEFAAVS
ncbi:CPBP family intramembrane glutamic endopeptidase [Kineothrix sp. MB12-C1]|uniref:CPBP family intramembrane glutamic endopeptidase n=1 Tax=Kineothrix sp. MB12-C1 TaxID=3070215 RepID=UPI0027D282B0|nr:type II CAAX endopeptidase family protein [Kineothrix sp. MB12-C1]WMC91183.1 type II CAAX endopeptidase family protein [Kineothrix sp. MB12-C1]